MDIKKIKEAVLAHHGGFENADDNEIKTLWNSLPKDVQEKYLKEMSTAKNEPQRTPRNTEK